MESDEKLVISSRGGYRGEASAYPLKPGREEVTSHDRLDEWELVEVPDEIRSPIAEPHHGHGQAPIMLSPLGYPR